MSSTENDVAKQTAVSVLKYLWGKKKWVSAILIAFLTISEFVYDIVKLRETVQKLEKQVRKTTKINKRLDAKLSKIQTILQDTNGIARENKVRIFVLEANAKANSKKWISFQTDKMLNGNNKHIWAFTKEKSIKDKDEKKEEKSTFDSIKSVITFSWLK